MQKNIIIFKFERYNAFSNKSKSDCIVVIRNKFELETTGIRHFCPTLFSYYVFINCSAVNKINLPGLYKPPKLWE